MEIFLDTADVQEVKRGKAWGLVDGVTTNPTLAAKTGKEFRALVREICEAVDGPVSAEVVATDARGMIEQGRSVREIHKHVVVKCPLTPEGLVATRTLTEDGHPVNVTLCFSPTQGLLAMKAGASYLSPFVGRLDDKSESGMSLVSDLVQIKENYGFDTKILVASVRHPLHVLEAALMGADVATMPFKVLEQMFQHPLTDIGLQQFLKDWEKSGLEL